MSDRYKYLFGPVPSRRFGRSLGVDLLKPKTCSFDCVFCQLGRTTDKTVKREEYVPTREVIAELEDWMAQQMPTYFVTLAGSGEPTLHSRFGEVLDAAGGHDRFRTAVLTNGSLLSMPEVRADAALADVVKISLSAWDDQSLRRVNRPYPEIVFKEIVEGIREFRGMFGGETWLEVFLVPGINARVEQVRRIQQIVAPLGFDLIQLNTAVRPPAEDTVSAVAPDVMAELAALFEPEAEVVAPYKGGQEGRFADGEALIAGILKRRPCSLEDLAAVSGMHPNEVTKYLGKLVSDDRATRWERDGKVLFQWREAQD